MITVAPASDPVAWDTFLASRRFTPFLQSWTMGEVYRDIGQDPLRFEARDGNHLTGICFAHVVHARRGKHLSVPYGPVVESIEAIEALLPPLLDAARSRNCAFVRISPFWPETSPGLETLRQAGARPSPLHLLAEHLWYLPLRFPDPWQRDSNAQPEQRQEQDIFAGMRATARNLIRRAEKEGVTITRSPHPVSDLPLFLALHEETRRRHGFTPYTSSFFRAQVSQFAPRNNVSLYLAHYKGEVIASSIHMHMGGETSYHHGASSQKYRTIPASYLLQWTALRDALERNDRVYNFWGVSPEGIRRHPFAGVRTFKTAFGGCLLPLVHCQDIPLSRRYLLTRAIETVRKWRRGF